MKREQIQEGLQYLLSAGFGKLPSIGFGERIWEVDTEWDILLVLDACRYDVFQNLYGNKYTINSHYSVASSSEEWMKKTFTDVNLDETVAYVSGNPFTEEVIADNSIDILSEVWKKHWDSEIGTIYPEYVSKEAIEVYKTNSLDKMVVHYMQPHHPYIVDTNSVGMSLDSFGEEDTTTPFDRQRQGELGRDDHIEMYKQNLRYAMETIEESILTHLDGDVVITADHAELFGHLGFYGHPSNLPVPTLRKVPWVEVEASCEETGQYEFDMECNEGALSQSSNSISTEERLSQLGYM